MFVTVQDLDLATAKLKMESCQSSRHAIIHHLLPILDGR